MSLEPLHRISESINIDLPGKWLLKTLTQENLANLLSIEQSITPLPWSENNLLSSLQSSHICTGLFCDEQLVAYSIFSLVVDEAELLLIGVAKPQQKKGIASLLFNTMEEKLSSFAQQIFLEVRESNKAAIVLYDNLGFNQLGVRENYYPAHSGTSGKKEDALIYAKSIGLAF